MYHDVAAPINSLDWGHLTVGVIDLRTHLTILIASMLALSILFLSMAAPTIATPSSSAVLILEETVSGGSSSFEATVAQELGMTVDVVDDAQWETMSGADFAQYRAIILGDPGSASPSDYSAAAANAATWGQSVEGNTVVIGSDPVDHRFSGGDHIVRKGIAFAIADSQHTGLYASL